MLHTVELFKDGAKKPFARVIDAEHGEFGMMRLARNMNSAFVELHKAGMLTGHIVALAVAVKGSVPLSDHFSFEITNERGR